MPFDVGQRVELTQPHDLAAEGVIYQVAEVRTGANVYAIQSEQGDILRWFLEEELTAAAGAGVTTASLRQRLPRGTGKAANSGVGAGLVAVPFQGTVIHLPEAAFHEAIKAAVAQTRTQARAAAKRPAPTTAEIDAFNQRLSRRGR